MMKRFIALILFIFITQGAWAQQENITPDILAYTRTQKHWNIFLLKEFRTFMNNLSMDIDPYQYQLEDNLVYSEDNIQHFISDEAKNLVQQVSVASGINIIDVVPELTVAGLGYTVSSIKPEIDPKEQSDGNVVLKSDISITGIEAYASEIKLSFLLSQSIQGKQIPALEVKILNPKVVLNEGKSLDFGLDVLFKEKKEKIELEFLKGNFDRITDALAKDPEMIDIVYDDIKIPNVSLQLMGRQISINEEKIKEIIAVHKPSLKTILIEQVRILFEKDGAMEIFKHFNGIAFDRNYWIDSSSESMFPIFLGIRDFSVPMKGIFKVELEGDFCTKRAFNSYAGECVNKRETVPANSTITKADFAYSKTNIETQLKEDNDIKFLASVSEDYINKVIVTTIDFGIWESIIEEIGIELGDRGVLVKLDKEGQNATVILDVIYDVGWFAGGALGERMLRFPVVLDATIRAEYYDVETQNEDGTVSVTSEPHIVFNLNDVNLDDSVLKYGLPKYGFPSTVKDVRKIFRKLVTKKIKKELFDYDAPTEPEKFAKWKGVDLPPLLLPEIRDMHLEKMNLESDAHGRLNLTLRGSDTIYRVKKN